MQQALSLAASAADFPTLPGRYQRGDVVRIITAIAPRLGLGAGALRALMAMIHMTRPSDWTSGQSDAICYREQMKVAEASGVTSRTIRTHEAIFERLGLILKQVGADGSRGRFARGEITLGISFRPLIERFSELLALAEQAEDETRHMEILRRKCSAARRTFNKAVSALLDAAPKHPMLLELLQAKASLPRRYEGLSVSELQGVYDAVDNAARDALIALSGSIESSGTPEEIDRPHIQATTEDDLEICSGSPAEDRTDRKRSDPNLYAATPQGAAEGIEIEDRMSQRGHKPDWTETFSPRTLYWMASDDFRLYVDVQRREGSPLTEIDFIQAAISLLPALGVHHSAWDEAAESMGDLPAALSVLVIDANRFHPEKPVHRPGAALRAFARLAVAGKLNLHGSLIGLKQRMEAKRGL